MPVTPLQSRRTRALRKNLEKTISFVVRAWDLPLPPELTFVTCLQITPRLSRPQAEEGVQSMSCCSPKLLDHVQISTSPPPFSAAILKDRRPTLQHLPDSITVTACSKMTTTEIYSFLTPPAPSVFTSENLIYQQILKLSPTRKA